MDGGSDAEDSSCARFMAAHSRAKSSMVFSYSNVVRRRVLSSNRLVVILVVDDGAKAWTDEVAAMTTAQSEATAALHFMATRQFVRWSREMVSGMDTALLITIVRSVSIMDD